MSSEHRLKRLRELRAELERMPASAERDRILQEVRARVVDVDTGAPPPAPRRRRPAAPAPKLDVPKPAASLRPRATAPPPPRVEVPPSAPVHLPRMELAPDVLLCLDDSTSFAPAEAGATAPWTRGLRG